MLPGLGWEEESRTAGTPPHPEKGPPCVSQKASRASGAILKCACHQPAMINAQLHVPAPAPGALWPLLGFTLHIASMVGRRSLLHPTARQAGSFHGWREGAIRGLWGPRGRLRSRASCDQAPGASCDLGLPGHSGRRPGLGGQASPRRRAGLPEAAPEKCVCRTHGGGG